MDTGVRRLLLIVDASIGNDFIENEELAGTLMRVRDWKYPEVIIIKNTQTTHHKEVMKEFFTVKAFPRKSIRKAIKLSSTILYMTDGRERNRRNSISKLLQTIRSKSIITIVR